LSSAVPLAVPAPRCFSFRRSGLKQSASDYDPVAFVEQTGIVLVTTDYRLNVFGFLAHPQPMKR
jgi:hypothetical protein